VALLAPYWPFPFAAERTPPVGAAVVVARVGHTQRVSLSVATVAELVRVLEQGDRTHGDRMKFLFFWGHRPEPGRSHRGRLPESMVAVTVHCRRRGVRHRRALHDVAKGHAVR
jgi:hypothetical protein